MTRKITAIGYGRATISGSTEAQADNIRRYAASRGLDLIAYYSDDGRTGATLRRPGLHSVIREVEEGRAKIVIVDSVDHLSRDEDHLRYLRKLFARKGVAVHALSDGPWNGEPMFHLKDC